MRKECSRATHLALTFTTTLKVSTAIFTTHIPGNLGYMYWILMFRKQQTSTNMLSQNNVELGLIQKAWALIYWALK